MVAPSDRDVEKRRDDALRRALTTPPKMHKPKPAKAVTKPKSKRNDRA